jgi:predicted DsbA family dithiol-disulfide isomerase
MRAYWGDGVDISDPEALAQLAAPSGLDHDEVIRVATEKPYEDRIGASTQAVYDMGGSGVPAFVVADKVLIPGAQPHELFDRVMDRLEIEPLDARSPE